MLDRPGRGLVAAVPSVTVAADELTLQQKFQSGVGTNLALDLFVGGRGGRVVRRRRIEQVARSFGLEGYARLDVFWDRVDDVVYLLEINSLCGLTEATVFYAQWLADPDPLPPWAVLDRIVEAGDRAVRASGGDHAGPGPADGQRAPMIRLDDLVAAVPGLERPRSGPRRPLRPVLLRLAPGGAGRPVRGRAHPAGRRPRPRGRGVGGRGRGRAGRRRLGRARRVPRAGGRRHRGAPWSATGPTWSGPGPHASWR